MEEISSRDNGLSHNINDYVMYRNNGICKINDIRRQQFGTQTRTYYVLESVYSAGSTVFIPTDSELCGQIRHLLTKDEIDAIIDSFDMPDFEWIDNSKERAIEYAKIIEEGDRACVLRLFRELTLYKNDVLAKKKKLYATDAKLLAAAEKLITEEFAFVLNIPREEVVPYIVGRMKQEV